MSNQLQLGNDLPSQGTYVYKRTEIKSQPRCLPRLNLCKSGDSVLYDQVVTATNGLATNHALACVVMLVKPVAAGSGNGGNGEGKKPSIGTQATTGTLDIPATGTFYFT